MTDFSAGGFARTAARTPPAPFAPEFSKSYEIGTKFSALDDRLNATVAVYKAEKSNILTTDPINAGFSMAAGEAESKGLEIDVSGKLTDDLSLNFAYAYTKAEVTKSALDPNFGLALPAGGPDQHPEEQREPAADPGVRGRRPALTIGGGVNYVSERLGETGVPSFVLPRATRWCA